MAQKNNGKRKWQWLLWTAFVILLLVVGLGPLAMLISLTQFDDTGTESIWDRIRGGSTYNYEQQVDPPPELPSLEPYMVQYLYRYCDHSYVFPPGNIPPDFPTPPNGLAELAAALQNSNSTIENIMDLLKDPEGWHMANMKEQGQPVFMLTYLDDFCPDCAEQQYLGTFGDRIAVYRGCPPNGKVIEVTEFEVKEIFQDELEQGVPFNSEAEKENYLISFTS